MSVHPLLEKVRKAQLRADLPSFKPGDTVRVHVKIKEGDKERIQVFEGTVIARNRRVNQSTFVVRKLSFGTGVERIFPLHSPVIEKIEVMKSTQVRRSKLYYLRQLKGKAARLREDRFAEAEAVSTEN
ncbi:MAG: 50S ribosomal protein L19 [Acidobacteriia bacterium]|nr:50S ribosomal protein L19 [Terriglobia bacterium]